jgi:hypothetical protein
MADDQCDHPGCSLPITERCERCGQAFCVRHIERDVVGALGTFYLRCAPCVEEARRESAERFKAESYYGSRAQSNQWRNLLVGIVLVVVGILMGVALGGGAGIIVALAIAGPGALILGWQWMMWI